MRRTVRAVASQVPTSSSTFAPSAARAAAFFTSPSGYTSATRTETSPASTIRAGSELHTLHGRLVPDTAPR